MERAGLEVEVVSPPEGRPGAVQVRRLCDGSDFSAAVLVSPFPAEAAAMAGLDMPMWVDINGHHPAEVQLHGSVSGRGWEQMTRILAMENLLLASGDRFSTPSRAQALAVMGELYLLGRLSAETAGLVPVEAIPHCVMPGWERRFEERSPVPGHIISTGSFNLWFDHATLFRALERAMDRSPQIRFTSTGGAIPFSPERYPEFRAMVQGSRHRDRFDLLGWVDRDRLAHVYRTAACAVYADLPGGETMLGARTRVLDWIGRGIPVVCTRGAEISGDLDRRGMGTAVPQGDPVALSEAMLEASLSASAAEAMVSRQREWCGGEGSVDRLFAPLTEWLEHPRRLPRRRAGRPTVPRKDGPSYLCRMFRMVLRDRGPAAAAARVLRRLLFLRGGSGG
jgi:glycosyltransferase involved in cell wall biosynthesis